MKDFVIKIASLSDGINNFDFKLNQDFFDSFQFEQEFESPDLKVFVTLDKKNNILDLNIKLEGEVGLLCDLSADLYQQKIKHEILLIVNFGQSFDDSDDEIITLPHGEDELDLSQYFYEMTLLSIPNKRYHPDLDEKRKKEILSFIQNDKFEKESDPRWAALNKLKEQNLN